MNRAAQEFLQMDDRQSWIERLKASPAGRAEYRLKCWLRQLCAPVRDWRDERYIRSIPAKVEALSRKSTVRVLFFAIHPAYWRSDTLYKLMLEHPRFSPEILVCGSVEHGKASMQRDTALMCRHLEEKGYSYRCAFDERTRRWVDVRKEINPDILLYAKPYEGLLPAAYEFDRFPDKLFIYQPYAMQTTNPPELCNTRYCRLSWMQFYENELVFQHSPILKRNSRITGSSKADVFLEHAAHPVSPWKTSAEHRTVKRVIWAPHHSIGGGSLAYSNFLTLADDFLDMARQLRGRMQFAFKPHPLLRRTLYEHKLWGRERTDRYYRAWAEEPNLQLEETDYVDLFLTSDALIHDCASFTAEYLMTGKPMMYLAKEHHDDTLNGFGIAAYSLHYQGSSMQDVERFLHEVVEEGNDPMAVRRNDFCRRYLLPPNNKKAAENMIDEILKFKP